MTYVISVLDSLRPLIPKKSLSSDHFLLLYKAVSSTVITFYLPRRDFWILKSWVESSLPHSTSPAEFLSRGGVNSTQLFGLIYSSKISPQVDKKNFLPRKNLFSKLRAWPSSQFKGHLSNFIYLFYYFWFYKKNVKLLYQDKIWVFFLEFLCVSMLCASSIM